MRAPVERPEPEAPAAVRVRPAVLAMAERGARAAAGVGGWRGPRASTARPAGAEATAGWVVPVATGWPASPMAAAARAAQVVSADPAAMAGPGCWVSPAAVAARAAPAAMREPAARPEPEAPAASRVRPVVLAMA